MDTSAAGMNSQTTGANGGWRGMNARQRRLALSLAGGFVVLVLLVMVVNATTELSDLAARDVEIPDHFVWAWEWSSAFAWVTIMPAVWWLTGRARRPQLSWPLLAAIYAAGAVLVSAWHVGLMLAIRTLYYAGFGAEYDFFGGMPDPALYEFRKDALTYLQLVAFAFGARWLIARAASEDSAPQAESVVRVREGNVVHTIPVGEIDWLESAGNYVSFAWDGREMLHRATLAEMETELAPHGFVRIHRQRLVRRAAIRSEEVLRSGDFNLTLASGKVVRGTRRYRL